MNKFLLALASCMALAFSQACKADLTFGDTATYTTSPIFGGNDTTANGGTSSVGDLITGPSTSSVGDLITGPSTATVGNLSTGASSSSGNTSGNNTVNSTYAAPKIPVSSAMSPANLPTAPCMGSTSVGVSGVLFGFSSGSSWEATECMTLEMARSFSQDGQLEDAQAVRCSSKYAANAPSCIKLLQQRSAIKPATAKVSYIKTIDPTTGFTTIIDTRGAYTRRSVKRTEQSQ
jgi:hypothetical protein